MDHRELAGLPFPVRLGSVPYVNALPLLHGLEDDLGVRVSPLAPARVASALAAGSLDAGLVPVVELLRQPGLVPVSDACIAALGPVDSVLLLLRREPAGIREVVLDPDSRTSQVLARIVLRELHGAVPAFREADPLDAWRRGDGDAVLVIGDPALRLFAQGVDALDLSAEWRRLAGLPFVFAVWAGRGGAAGGVPALEERLSRARDEGVASPEPLRRAAARLPDLPEELLRRYLTERIRYRLGAQERDGLAGFLELAAGESGSRA